MHNNLCHYVEDKMMQEGRVNSEIHANYGGHKNFLRENSFDFINYSYIDDCDYWNVNDMNRRV